MPLTNVVLSSNPCPICSAASGKSMTEAEWRASEFGLTDSKKRYCNRKAIYCHCIMVEDEALKDLPNIGDELLRGDKGSGIEGTVDIHPNEVKLKNLMDRYNKEIGRLPKEIYDMSIDDIIPHLENLLSKEVGIPGLPWKPSMTRLEAETWAKDSALKIDIFHGTKAASKIKKTGFKDSFIGSNTGNAGMYGKGHYFASNPGYAQIYGDANFITVKVNVKNVCSWSRWKELAKKHNFDGFFEKYGAMEAPVRITKILKSYGYDAAKVAGSRLPQMEIVVFDAKNLVVITGGG